MSPVLQSIAVISSETAAGYADFMAQLENNIYGYEIHAELFQVAVQGRNVESDVVEAFSEIQANGKQYDAVTIVRGGGSKLDLAGFDNYNIGHAIAMCRLPVIIGIGHEIDSTVTDLVAQVSLKTPTAVAGYIIDRNMKYETDILGLGFEIQENCLETVRERRAEVEHIDYMIKQSALNRLHTEKYDLNHLFNSLKVSAKNIIQHNLQYLDNTESLIGIVDPIKTLKRGFSIIKQDGVVIGSVKDLDTKKEIEIVMKDGSKNI